MNTEMTMTPLTCILSGPLIFTATGGKSPVKEATSSDREQPLLAAMLADEGCEQVVAAWPAMGVVKDYRKATLKDVCAALDAEGREYL
jgi:hypothetical protein